METEENKIDANAGTTVAEVAADDSGGDGAEEEIKLLVEDVPNPTTTSSAPSTTSSSSEGVNQELTASDSLLHAGELHSTSAGKISLGTKSPTESLKSDGNENKAKLESGGSKHELEISTHDIISGTVEYGPFDAEFQLWHTITPKETVERTGTHPKRGLSTEEAKHRLELFGPNSFVETDRWVYLKRLWGQINNILIYVLAVAGVIAYALGKYVDGSVIMGVLIINIIVGFIMENSAEKAAQAIKNLLPSTAIVVRDGKKTKIPGEEVVPGDILVVKSGDKVAADMRLIKVKGVAIAEAALTGESLPQEKHLEPVDEQEPLGDQTCMAFSGTIVTSGSGTGVVVRTGHHSEMGKINKLVKDVKTEKAELLKKLDYFAKWLSIGVILFSVFAFFVTYFGRKYTLPDSFLIAISMAVSAIPEGLPAVVTIVLSRAVKLMADRKAIIRQLPAVETLGSVTVICSDKTGTLTKNEMTAVTFAGPKDVYRVTGTGYDINGTVERLLDTRRASLRRGISKMEFSMAVIEALENNSPPSSPPPGAGPNAIGMQEVKNASKMSLAAPVDAIDHSVWDAVAHCALLCSNAEIHLQDGRYNLVGEPTEGAIVCFAEKLGYHSPDIREKYPRLDIVPFESTHRFMASLHDTEDPNMKVIYVKGAPEKIATLCKKAQVKEGELIDMDVEYWDSKGDDMRSSGLRTLGIAKVMVAADKLKQLSVDYIESLHDQLIFLGVFGILDPPRPDAIEAVRVCHEAGIVVKMITGDHPATAAAIAGELGIPNKKVLTGVEVSNMNEEELKAEVAEVCVFARASPQNKIQIVQALRALKQIVAMTGDGVNDAPALRQAHIGVAMGINGTDSAKEASKMVLADDNFATIAAAVRIGRVVYTNVQKTIVYVLPTNISQALIVFMAVVIGTELPINAVQILWVNMITSVTLGMVMAWEEEDGNTMAVPPRRTDKTLWEPILIWRMIFVGFLFAGGVFGIFQYEISISELPEAQASAVNQLVMAQAFYLFNSRFQRSRSLQKKLFTTNYMTWVQIFILVILQVIFLYVPFVQYIFRTDGIDGAAWGRAIAFGVVVFIVMEIEKFFINNFVRDWWRSFRRRTFGPKKEPALKVVHVTMDGLHVDKTNPDSPPPF